MIVVSDTGRREQATARMRSANRRISEQLYQYVRDYIRKPG